jgi:predicted metallo-beta-lactamase superfamily hydrolase
MTNLSAAAQAYAEAMAIYHETNQRSRGLEPAAGLARVAYAQGDHTGALARVESIIAAVQQRALDATIEAEWVYLSCLQISHATDDSTHVAVLTLANQLYDQRCVMLSENGDPISRKTQLHTFCNALAMFELATRIGYTSSIPCALRI